MKASREVKQWVANRRSQDGKKNGVVRWLWDNPKMERKDLTAAGHQIFKSAMISGAEIVSRGRFIGGGSSNIGGGSGD